MACCTEVCCLGRCAGPGWSVRVWCWCSGLAVLGGLVFVSEAGATPCQTGSATITAVGESCYTVPSGVTNVMVVAVGAQGGDGAFLQCGHGGFGAQVTGGLPVAPGEILYVEVGGQGTSAQGTTAGAGGSNGGGSGGGGAAGGGGGGGGASDVRTLPVANDLASVR